jgi:hypothetical protein
MAFDNSFVRKGVVSVAVAAIGAMVTVGGCSAGESGTSEPGAPKAGTVAAEGTTRRLDLPRAALALADVVLPIRADAATVVTDRATKMRVAFALMDARPVAAEVKSGLVTFDTFVTFPGAGPGGSTVRFYVGGGGTEDFVDFERKPRREEVRYRVDVRAAAGLRLVENVLELVDARGVPRLRMASPYVLDRNGQHDAHVTLEDCAADRDPAGPWDRPVTAPGRTECAVRIAWGGSGDPVLYPAALDPKWTATAGTMTDARRGHTATLLASGKVLIAGGESTGGTTTYKKTAELFDPATQTFAATGSMTDGRSFHGAARLSTGNVVIAGGNGGAAVLASTEIYDVTTAMFRTGGGLTHARGRAELVAFGTTQALIVGGQDTGGTVLDTAELFDGTAETWRDTGRMATRRVGHYLTTLPTGQALVVAGVTSQTLGDLGACERFAASGTWTATGGLGETRHEFAGTSFSSGKILVAGGYQASAGKVLTSAELFDPSQAKWAPAGTLTQARTDHTLTALPSGAAVAAGGLVRDITGQITSYLKSAELFDPASKTWTALADMTEARAFHTATLLDDGRVLIAGGGNLPGATVTAEILTLDPDGTACTSVATCASGFCADSVCCKTACDAICTACAVAITGKPSGTCAPVLAANDPRNDCTDDGTPSCKKDGLCDGAGACESYAGATCTPKPCTAGKECTSGFCADGICCNSACTGKCQACTATKKGSGGDGTCGPIKTGTDPDAECGLMGTGTCSGDGLCDGAGACRVPAAGNACAPAACVDTETLGAAATCSPAGDCTPYTTSCIPFRCDATTVKCKTTCTGDTDCATGAHCKAGTCARSANGAACTAGTDCTSVQCVDGVCCDTDCLGQCAACDVAGAEGTCSAVPAADAPHGSRSACNGDAPCAGHCNGLAATGCVYPTSETACGTTTSCVDGVETGDRCNSRGDCVSTPTNCTPFACGADACNTECTKGTDCAEGARCSSGVCEAAACPDGGTPGVDGGACQPPPSGHSGGCGCRTAPRSALRPARALLVLVLGATLCRARARSTRRRRAARLGRKKTRRCP